MKQLLQAIAIVLGGFVVLAVIPFTLLTWWQGPTLGFFGLVTLWLLGFLVFLEVSDD